MKRSSLSAIVLLTLLAGLIMVPPAAAEFRSGPALSAFASILEHLWSFVTFQAKNGCIIHPSGGLRCEPMPAVTTTKNGCIIDPDGVPRCEPSPVTITTENGCRIDPDGACRQ